MNRLLVCLAFVLWLAPSPLAQSSPAPASLSLDGRAPITLAAQASRLDLLGAVELYTVAIYTDGVKVDRGELMSAETTKALRIQIVYDEDPRRRIAIDWRRELVPRLEGPATTHIHGSFAPIQHGDVIVVEYVSQEGNDGACQQGGRGVCRPP